MPRSRWVAMLGWLGAAGVLTAGMIQVQAYLDKAHVALVYLLFVLWASARGGRVPGLIFALVGFLCFNFFFLAPYHTFVVSDPVDWLVLATFLTVATVAAKLLADSQREAEEARLRADEINTIASLGAQALNAPRPEDALQAIAEVIRSTIDVDRCDIYLPQEAGEVVLATEAARSTGVNSVTQRRSSATAGDGSRDAGLDSAAAAFASRTAVIQRLNGTIRLTHPGEDFMSQGLSAADSARAVLLPLRVHERMLGVLRIASGDAIQLTVPEARFFLALSYYAALAAERVSLTHEAARADSFREADRLKDALLASVSHDLRTPLTTIKALAHDLSGSGDERAKIIEVEADRLNGFVGDLLDLSRLNAGVLPLKLEVAAAEDLIGAALRRVAPSVGGDRLVTHVGEAEPLLLGRFDFVQSLRVLTNLLENAHKYSPAGSLIEIEAARRGDELVFEVLDSGPGIEAAEVERAFEPFYQTQGGSPLSRGAGLGLSIARRLARAQGGDVRYRNRPGGGSIFEFTVAAAEAFQGDGELEGEGDSLLESQEV